MQASEPEGDPAVGPASSSVAPGLLLELGQFGRALKHLFGAQLHLLAAELGLARSAVSWLLVAGLAATVAGVGLGLSLLALIGFALAQWFGSWLWALVGLSLLQLVFLGGAILLFRRCMHWMTMPATRSEWSAMMHDTMGKIRQKAEAAKGSDVA